MWHLRHILFIHISKTPMLLDYLISPFFLPQILETSDRLSFETRYRLYSRSDISEFKAREILKIARY